MLADLRAAALDFRRLRVDAAAVCRCGQALSGFAEEDEIGMRPEVLTTSLAMQVAAAREELTCSSEKPVASPSMSTDDGARFVGSSACSSSAGAFSANDSCSSLSNSPLQHHSELPGVASSAGLVDEVLHSPRATLEEAPLPTTPACHTLSSTPASAPLVRSSPDIRPMPTLIEPRIASTPAFGSHSPTVAIAEVPQRSPGHTAQGVTAESCVASEPRRVCDFVDHFEKIMPSNIRDPADACGALSPWPFAPVNRPKTFAIPSISSVIPQRASSASVR